MRKHGVRRGWWPMAARHPRRGLALGLTGVLVVAALGVAVGGALAHADAAPPAPTTTNPYGGATGMPDCTWYAWQRLHDTLRVDMQPAGNAGQWATLAEQPYAFWWEARSTYVSAQLEPDLTSTPAPGDVVVYPDPVAGWAYPYHVAFVEQVEGDRYFISEQSYQDFAPGPKTTPYPYVTHRWVSLTAMRQAEPHGSFIHFGAPIGDDGQLIGASRALSVEPGQRFSVSFTERNTGFHTWSDKDGYTLSCAASCMGTTSAGFAGATVPPGQRFQFNLTLTAPATPGEYHSRWELRQQGQSFGATEASIAVNVADDQSRLQSPPVGVEARPGQLVAISFTFENTGRTTWSRAGGYALACDAFVSGSSACSGSVAYGLLGRQQVKPGQALAFTVLVITPASRGTYSTTWDMQHNGIAFGDTSARLEIAVDEPVTGETWPLPATRVR